MKTDGEIVHIVGVVRAGTGRYPILAQRRACIEAGATDIFEINKDMPLESVATDWRSGHRVVVQHLWLVAPYRQTPRIKRDAVVLFLDLVTREGGEVYEASTGRSSLDPDQRREMLGDALENVTRWRAPPSDRPPGRPRRAEAMDARAHEIWQDVETYPTYAACEKAWGRRKWGSWQKAYRLWGSRKAMGRRK